ncbi:hypothetical protein PWT90_05785 [Aphanocladium album]|nr:hypothetical protein PWT90_05785 [Aphanocladium album]
MSIIAPVARHIGLEPLSHHHSRCRRRSSELVAAHVLAAAHAVVPRRSSVVDPQTSVVSAQLSLKGLLQSDNVQTIQENLVILARFAGHLPRDVEATRSSVTNDELLIMGKLVRDISASLERIGSLREDDEEVLPDVADKYVPMRPISSVTRRRRKEKMRHAEQMMRAARDE